MKPDRDAQQTFLVRKLREDPALFFSMAVLRPHPGAQPQHVYFAERADGLIKIGISVDPAKRMRQLSVAATLLAVWPHVGRPMEAWLHDRFRADRVELEWFKPTNALLRMIESVQVVCWYVDHERGIVPRFDATSRRVAA